MMDVNAQTPREIALGNQLYRKKKEVDQAMKSLNAIKRDKHEKFVIAALQALIARVPFEKNFNDEMMMSIVDLAYDFGDMMLAIKYEGKK